MLGPDGEQDVIALFDAIGQVGARQGDDTEDAGIHDDTGRGDLAHRGMEGIDLTDKVRDFAAIGPIIQGTWRRHLQNFAVTHHSHAIGQ